MARKVRIELILDADGVVQGFGRVGDEVEGVNDSLSRARKGLSTFKKVLGAAFFGAAAQGAVRLARRLFELGTAVEETASKFNTVFGEMAESVDEFGESFANMAGLTQREFQDVASVIGSILQGIGADIQTTASETERIIRLAADLASFNNISIQEAFAAIRSGLVGQNEPLQRYGILLDATKTKTEALRASGKENEKQLTELEKVQARLTLITRGAGKAIGDQERTQDSAANKAKKLTAQLREQADVLATELLPVMTEVLDAFAELVEVNQEAIISTTQSIGELAKGTLLLFEAIQLVKGTSPRGQSFIEETFGTAGILGQLIPAWKELNETIGGSGPDSTVEIIEELVDVEGKLSAETLALVAQINALNVVTDDKNDKKKKEITLMQGLRNEITGLTEDLKQLKEADQDELIFMLRRIDALEKELRIRTQAARLLAVPEAAPVLGVQPLKTRTDDEVFAAGRRRIELEGEKQEAILATAEAERAASEAAITSAVAIGVAQANILGAILATVRQIIQARLAEAIAGAVASSSILGPIAGAAAGALMAVLFNQLMPSGHKGSAGATGARADTTSTQGVALGGIRVQSRGVTTGATGAAASARAQTVTIRVIEPDLFRLNTELSNADGVRGQVGAI